MTYSIFSFMFTVCNYTMISMSFVLAHLVLTWLLFGIRFGFLFDLYLLSHIVIYFQEAWRLWSLLLRYDMRQSHCSSAQSDVFITRSSPCHQFPRTYYMEIWNSNNKPWLFKIIWRTCCSVRKGSLWTSKIWFITDKLKLFLILFSKHVQK